MHTRRRTGEEDRPNYSGKHKSHGLLFLALTDEKGKLVWTSPAAPGRFSEITTARRNKITAQLRRGGLEAIACPGAGQSDQHRVLHSVRPGHHHQDHLRPAHRGAATHMGQDHATGSTTRRITQFFLPTGRS
nr:transposase family protein [Streptomyces sp. 846.5]